MFHQPGGVLASQIVEPHVRQLGSRASAFPARPKALERHIVTPTKHGKVSGLRLTVRTNPKPLQEGAKPCRANGDYSTFLALGVLRSNMDHLWSQSISPNRSVSSSPRRIPVSRAATIIILTTGFPTVSNRSSSSGLTRRVLRLSSRSNLMSAWVPRRNGLLSRYSRPTAQFIMCRSRARYLLIVAGLRPLGAKILNQIFNLAHADISETRSLPPLFENRQS